MCQSLRARRCQGLPCTEGRICNGTIARIVRVFDRATPAGIKLGQVYRDQGATVVFEPNSIRDEKLFARACNVAHVLKYSQERLDAYQDLLEPAKVMLHVETMGSEGLQFRLRSGPWTRMEAFPAPVFVDAAGSGDWVTATLIDHAFRTKINWLKVKADTINHGLANGQALAAINCGFAGARGLMYHMTPAAAMKQAQDIVTKRTLSPAAKVSQPQWASWNICSACDEGTIPPIFRAEAGKST